MVTLPGILSPVTEVSLQRYGIPIEDKVSIEIERVYHEMGELINPLASVRTRRQLEAELNRRAQESLSLRNKAGELLATRLDEVQLVSTLLQSYRDFSNLIMQADTVLSSKEKKLMLDLIDSLSDLLETFAEDYRSERPVVTDILQECSAPLHRVDMCLFALLLVLIDEIKQWNIDAIKLLCHTADKYMLQVEDTFLSHNKELGERLRKSSATLSLEEVRRVIELSS